ncbi:MAG: hypothetical protein AAF085_06430, partial [Planctomycetota bacterium]
MPPVTILSPYSGRPVKVREQDLGRALRDEEGRIFYIVEDPEHGRYAARTRKGSPKDLERYREIEAKSAKLDSDPDRPATSNLQAHDATGKKRRNPIGLLFVVVLVVAIAALGYVYLNHPGWLGLDKPAEQVPESETDADSEQSQSPGITPANVLIKTPPQEADPSAPGIAAAPLQAQGASVSLPAQPNQ